MQGSPLTGALGLEEGRHQGQEALPGMKTTANMTLARAESVGQGLLSSRAPIDDEARLEPEGVPLTASAHVGCHATRDPLFGPLREDLRQEG